MDVFARTSAMRDSATQYGAVESKCLDVAGSVSSCAKELSGAITDPAVSTAVGASLVAVLRELELIGGTFAYSRSELGASADAYDAADQATARHLDRLVPGAP